MADWSTPGSTPLICPRSVPPALKPGPARGLPVPPGTREWLHLDIDAAITIDHSDNKPDTAPTWKKTFGHHPLLVFLDRPETAGGEPLAVLRPGNVGPTTAADNVTILGWVVDSLPTPYRPNPDDPGAQQILVRSRLRRRHPHAVCLAAGVGLAFGLPRRRPRARRGGNPQWRPQLVTTDRLSGGIRDGAWVAEATHLLQISRWPAGPA